MKRRRFIGTSVAAGVTTCMLNSVLESCNRSSTERRDYLKSGANDKVLVLVQLEGGNDGLNTVIPLDQYANLINARKNILIPEGKVLPLNNTSLTGFHPALSELQKLYNNNHVAIVQGTGYSNPDLSHFKAMDIWDTGSDSSSATAVSTGWLGRFLGQYELGDYPLAVQIGTSLSKALQGHTSSTGMVVRSTSNFYNLAPGPSHYDPTVSYGPFNTQLSRMREMVIESKRYQEQVKKAAARQTNLTGKYPAHGINPLADELKMVAQLIGGGLKTKVYLVILHGFDTHASQVDPQDITGGVHAHLLSLLSDAIAAFMDDIYKMNVQDRVVGLVYSEFGRRIKSNASDGTDHGTAAPVILFGSRVKSGLVGHNPIIEAKVTVDDNLSLQNDFRSVYASVLKGWFGLPDKNVNEVLQGNYTDLNLFKV